MSNLIRPFRLGPPKGSITKENANEVTGDTYIAGWWSTRGPTKFKEYLKEGHVQELPMIGWNDLYSFNNYWDAWAYQCVIDEMMRKLKRSS